MSVCHIVCYLKLTHSIWLLCFDIFSPSIHRYATASARSDGMLLLCGGRDSSGMPLSDAYGLLMHTNGKWEWTLAPGVSPSPRYQHAAGNDASCKGQMLVLKHIGDICSQGMQTVMVLGRASVGVNAVVFVGARLHVTGGALKGGRNVEGEASIAVLDTAAGVWLDRNGVVTSTRTHKSPTDNDGSLELLRRCRHALASVGTQVYVFGGLKGVLLPELLRPIHSWMFEVGLVDPIVAQVYIPEGLFPLFFCRCVVQLFEYYEASIDSFCILVFGLQLEELGQKLWSGLLIVVPPLLLELRLLLGGSLIITSFGKAYCWCFYGIGCLDGFTVDVLLDDFLVAENSTFQSEVSSSMSNSGSVPSVNYKPNQNVNLDSQFAEQPLNKKQDSASSARLKLSSLMLILFAMASAAEAEAVSAVWRAARENISDDGDSEFPIIDETSGEDDLSDVPDSLEPGVRLHPRAVVVAKETVGNLGGLVRQLSLDQFENESRRMYPTNVEQTYPTKKFLNRQKSPEGLHKKASIQLANIFRQEPTVLQLKAPVKVFGDLHGQFGDLMRLFDEYGSPSTAGDITYIDYLFLGDYVDRGQHSLETITLLLALKIENPENIHLIRGNHEAADINALFGFRLECIERMGESDGIWAWTRFNQLFNYLPLAALIEKKIICMHGGIGRSINSVDQIEKLERPINMDVGSIVLMDLLWSDPTENDSIEGLRPNARGPGLVTFGPDRVTEFCKRNKLQLIIRAHECVMDGFERFAQGQLITLFSATNYCGTANNAGAILVVGRGLVIVPKLIHPLPPPLQSPESSPEHVLEDTWMQELNIQRPPTPTRGRPQSANDRSSLAYI
ncbi:hypothetical protein ZIOFF_013572 [Zingiber officinale]|uniref:Serine/threonine-protein phosphatase n=1 Tax=Zingiber officinale TaxID=94328 RepID=A0A8J5LUA4_ZINOF|nr:hypothetical protein ZIOFF_013572 [Zingiber officinale]